MITHGMCQQAGCGSELRCENEVRKPLHVGSLHTERHKCLDDLRAESKYKAICSCGWTERPGFVLMGKQGWASHEV
jgi:hypothetical protein